MKDMGMVAGRRYVSIYTAAAHLMVCKDWEQTTVGCSRLHSISHPPQPLSRPLPLLPHLFSETCR
jgi:hypothetical protein